MGWGGEESFGKMGRVSWTTCCWSSPESSGCESVSQGLADYCLWPKSDPLLIFIKFSRNTAKAFIYILSMPVSV